MVFLEIRYNDIVDKRCRVAREADDILELRALPDGGHLRVVVPSVTLPDPDVVDGEKGLLSPLMGLDPDACHALDTGILAGLIGPDVVPDLFSFGPGTLDRVDRLLSGGDTVSVGLDDRLRRERPYLPAYAGDEIVPLAGPVLIGREGHGRKMDPVRSLALIEGDVPDRHRVVDPDIRLSDQAVFPGPALGRLVGRDFHLDVFAGSLVKDFLAASYQHVSHLLERRGRSLAGFGLLVSKHRVCITVDFSFSHC